jgi:hypothetical protein
MAPNHARRIRTEEEARTAYRAAWLAWRESTDEQERRRLEILMDGCQPDIATGPADPRWKEFAASLPGFLEFWEAIGKVGELAADAAATLVEEIEKKPLKH